MVTIPYLVAHRGYMECFPENTLMGIEAALQCGATHVEFDVQCASDGTFVVLHDSTLERTCGLAGEVFHMSWEALRRIPAHEPARFCSAFIGQHIPSLAQVTHLLQQYPHATAFVEIKGESVERYGIYRIMPALLEQLQVIQSQCVVISFHADAIAYVRDHSDFRCGLVLHRYDADGEHAATAIGPDYLILNHRKLTADIEFWRGAWEWMLYDITDADLALYYAGLGASLIETRSICSMLKHPLLALKSDQHA